MKIGILTQPLKFNYGGILQNYALQQVLIRSGHEVETIDWEPPKNVIDYVFRILGYIKAYFFPSKYKKPNYRPNNKENAVIYKNTNDFINKYIRKTGILSSHSEFKKLSDLEKYDAYVVGSDQCWRPRYNWFLKDMFLSFCEKADVVRVAYAASFGTDYWEYTKYKERKCSELAQKFDFISVREDSGIELCKRHLGVDAVHVLDPTMLLSKSDYVKIVEEENEVLSIGTLFNYILDPNEKKNKFVRRIESVNKLKAFQVLPKKQKENRTKTDIKHNIEDCVYPSVTAWLRAFMDAEMTVVDSFHGMVFSIIFNKPFWVIGNEERGMSRFLSLLKIFNLEDRLVDVEDIDNVDVSSPINWGLVNEIWSSRKENSLRLLTNSLR